MVCYVLMLILAGKRTGFFCIFCKDFQKNGDFYRSSYDNAIFSISLGISAELLKQLHKNIVGVQFDLKNLCDYSNHINFMVKLLINALREDLMMIIKQLKAILQHAIKQYDARKGWLRSASPTNFFAQTIANLMRRQIGDPLSYKHYVEYALLLSH